MGSKFGWSIIPGKCEGTHGGIYEEVARARGATDKLYGKRARKVKSLIIG